MRGQDWASGRVHGTAAFEPDRDGRLAKGAGTCDQCEEGAGGSGGAEDSEAFFLRAAQQDEQQEILRRMLIEDGTEDMQNWANQIGPTDLSEVPPSLHRPLAHLDWSGVLLTDPHEAIDTDWQPLPPSPVAEVREAPLGWLSAVRPMYRAGSKRRFDSFMRKLQRWLAKECERPDCSIIPGKWLEYWVHEVPHDFHSKPGFAVPVDIGKASPSHLNLDFLDDLGQGYLDQELVSFLVLGVRYKADLPVQIVLQPHLQSFLPVQKKYLQEADKFVMRGWSVLAADGLPLVPFFAAACGSVERALEPDRPRQTNDAGAPRHDVWDDDGIRVIPLNEAIVAPLWPKESKPCALDVVIAIRVLLEAAQELNTIVYVVCDDYKSFFNQLRLSPSEYCKTGVIQPPRPSPLSDDADSSWCAPEMVAQAAGNATLTQRLLQIERACSLKSATAAYDTVLGFGIKMASNISQRFADFIINKLKHRLQPVMDKLTQQLQAKHSGFAE